MKVLLLAPMGSVHRQHNKANISALKQLGAEISLLANFTTAFPREKQNAEFVKKCISDNVNIINIPFKRGGFFYNIKYIPKVVSIIRSENYNIVHAHTETGGLFLRIAMIFLPKGIKYVYTAHGMSFWKGSPLKTKIIYKIIERWICSGMDMNIGINKEEVSYLKEWNEFTASYVHGVGIDLSKFRTSSHSNIRQEFNVQTEDLLIVSVGELDDNKNHVTVIKALSTIKQRNFKYLICGVGPNKELLENEAARLLIKDNVILAGYRTDISDILNAADIFVFPSFHEGMPVSALEAMACGLPVVCSEIRGNVDIVQDGINGFLFAPTNSILLSQRLLMLMDDKQLRKSMGKKNETIVGDFSIESVAEELHSIYFSLDKSE